MLALFGRQCSVYAYPDICPLVLMWTFYIGSAMSALFIPLQNCQWIVSSTNPMVTGVALPTAMSCMFMFIMSIISSTILAVVDEMWSMWDPLGKAINTFSWTLGLAMEIDTMLNEFDEHDPKCFIRRQSYMGSSGKPSRDFSQRESSGSGSRPQTV